jgi:hypothetical protein
MHIGGIAEEPALRLVSFPPGSHPKHWATLSYCWGTEPSTKLTSSTLPLFEQALAMDSLDATVYDTISVIRGLGIEFLWIDALCIVQNDPHDKDLQMAKMRYIYEHSIVTLVTTHTSSVTQGFLSSRDVKYVPVSFGGHSLSSIASYRQVPENLYLSKSGVTEEKVLAGPWSYRAWTMQEGLLPNRLLYYSSTEIVWKCCEATYFERGPIDRSGGEVVRQIIDEGITDFWSSDLFTKTKSLRRYLSMQDSDYRHEEHRLWYEIVKEYSPRLLGKSSDRLIALSGLAETYATILVGDEYLAGLWRMDMIRGLLWRTPQAKLLGAVEAQCSSRMTYAAPSWSWASAGVGLVVENDWAQVWDFQELATIKEVTSRHDASTGPSVWPSNNTIVLRGRTFHFRQLYNPDWQSTSAEISAFERHLSRVIEQDYNRDAVTFSNVGNYLAILMLQEFPSLTNSVDVMLLEANQSITPAKPPTFSRIGVVSTGYVNKRFMASANLIAGAEHLQGTLTNHLDPTRGFKRSRRLLCEDVWKEMHSEMWQFELVHVV